MPISNLEKLCLVQNYEFSNYKLSYVDVLDWVSWKQNERRTELEFYWGEA